jgi:hypothetical protein
MLVEAESPLNRGVPQHVGSKPYTSIDAASDAEVLGDIPIDPYVGTALGTLREIYCAQNSDLPSAAVADALAWVECETRNRLSKDYMLTGSLVCKCMRVDIKRVRVGKPQTWRRAHVFVHARTLVAGGDDVGYASPHERRQECARNWGLHRVCQSLA